jgi:hypothetical protein
MRSHVCSHYPCLASHRTRLCRNVCSTPLPCVVACPLCALRAPCAHWGSWRHCHPWAASPQRGVPPHIRCVVRQHRLHHRARVLEGARCCSLGCLMDCALGLGCLRVTGAFLVVGIMVSIDQAGSWMAAASVLSALGLIHGYDDHSVLPRPHIATVRSTWVCTFASCKSRSTRFPGANIWHP